MKKRNIWEDVTGPLELHSDMRGRLADIFYKQNINHVAIIESNPGVLRGDHYHKSTTQHMLMIKGGLEYWYKPLKSDERAKCVILREGDLVTTPPLEIHALRILPEGNQFIVFSEGLRGGKDYELDTFRLNDSIIKNEN